MCVVVYVIHRNSYYYLTSTIPSHYQDMARDVRETKVHYSPSEKDGIFVVEAARGADSNSTPILTNINVETSMTNEQILSNAASLQAQAAVGAISRCQNYESSHSQASGSKSNEQVLVHPPPNGMCADDDVIMIDEDGTVSISSPKLNGIAPIASISHANTGLSQSDLSVSSSGGSNQAYSYGTQQPYSIDTQSYQPPQTQIVHAADVIELNTLPNSAIVINNAEPVDQIVDIEMMPNGKGDSTIESVTNTNEELVVPPPEFDGSDAFVRSTSPVKIDANANTDKVQQNGIKSFELAKIDVNGKTNGDHTNGFNGNGHLNDESNEFDSLMNLPAPPPPSTCEEKLTALDSNNMDVLPPPPPELVPVIEAINVES